jgi:hypothetical protein
METKFLETITNQILIIATRFSENVFGIKTQKSRLYGRRLHSAPEMAQVIVLTTCILHHYIRSGSVNVCALDDEPSASKLQPLTWQGGNALQDAFDIREAFKDFFCSSHGSVEWRKCFIIVTLCRIHTVTAHFGFGSRASFSKTFHQNRIDWQSFWFYKWGSVTRDLYYNTASLIKFCIMDYLKATSVCVLEWLVVCWGKQIALIYRCLNFNAPYS